MALFKWLKAAIDDGSVQMPYRRRFPRQDYRRETPPPRREPVELPSLQASDLMVDLSRPQTHIVTSSCRKKVKLVDINEFAKKAARKMGGQLYADSEVKAMSTDRIFVIISAPANKGRSDMKNLRQEFIRRITDVYEKHSGNRLDGINIEIASLYYNGLKERNIQV